MAKRILYGLPIGLAALLLGACSMLLVVNLLAVATGHPPVQLVPKLSGVVRTSKLPWSAAAVLDGRLQAEVAHEIGSRMPLYPWAVRLRNQVVYWLFSSSPTPSLVVGRGQQLTEPPYLDDWCTRDIAAWRPGAIAWAAEIRAMQDRMERRGKAFLYVLTPSKVAQYPDIVPSTWPCRAPEADRIGWLPAWRAILRDAGVHVADAAGAVSAAHADYPFRLFSPGGAHWNAVGGAVAQQAIMQALDRMLPGRGLAPFNFHWRMARHASGNDLDLARLMNLFVPVGNGPQPAITVEPAPAPMPCRPPKVVIVGGSFSQWTVERLAQLPCAVPIVVYVYWQFAKFIWFTNQVIALPGVDTTARDADILSADVLIYEENEQIMRMPRHGQALAEFLRAHEAP